MDRLSKIIKETFDAALSPDFVKQVTYQENLDTLEYCISDCIMVAHPVDELFYVLKKADTDEIVGFQIHNVKDFITKIECRKTR